MSTERDLSRLFEAERGEIAPASAAAQGLARLESALAAGTRPMDISLASGFWVSTLAKWGIGVGGVAVVAFGVALSPNAEPPRAAPSAVVHAPVVATARPVAESAAPTINHELRSKETAQQFGSASRDATFEEELRLIKRAKREIDSGRGHLGEVWLDEHARRFPHGVFRVERDALRILVLCAGDPARGAPRAQDFVRVNPRSPLVDRISRACGLAGAARP
jgi:hypothetical protein